MKRNSTPMEILFSIESEVNKRKEMKRKKKNKIQELKEKAEIFILCLICLIILLIGCHYEATYVVKGTVFSINEDEDIVSFEIKDNIFECEATETELLNEGDEFWIKLTNEATESNFEDDHLIDFGKHSFLCFVW